MAHGREAGNKVYLDKEALLRGRDYFFHVPWPTDVPEEERSCGAYRYPIVPSFQHWSFPHDSPPPGWSFNPDLTANVASLFPVPSISSVSQAVRDRDGSCRLSGYQDGIERAHLCPRSEVQWFTQQEMDRYNISGSLVGLGLVDDTANALALRSDIHLSFDAGRFVFTRKRDQWVSHFLTPTSNLGPEYHNTTVEIPSSVHPAFLLARLAWAIFPGIRNFLIRGEKRLVTLRQETGSAWDVKELDREHLCCVLGIQPRGRSNSPTKRQREADTTGGATDASATASKRARLHLAESPQPAEPLARTHSPPATTPELCNADAGPTPSPSQPSEPPVLHTNGETDERRRIGALRQSALKAQRPINPGLLCCDYDAAEVANAAGLEGPRTFGGAHLCMECLGMEYRDEEGCAPTPIPTMRDGGFDFPAPD
ncbi:hypothetical protein H2199_008965 [Coniosporium tulheliwenetii]|uniref:Uncharacterized protein n=1 Tax=Coniosporium tulheliwenetii TaxID=3383036 RepID=A0ACC2YGX0_9PEZI|nr:hypothetical protein H2199_008965 [Cladosporium sp. JES 115]